jgi:hypothetical protein
MFKKLIPLLFLLSGFQANATIIDNDIYTTDTATGLDWLDVTATLNLSSDTLSAQFAVGDSFEGWRYATGSEFNTVWSNITGGNPIDESTNSIDSYILLFGSTSDALHLALGVDNTDLACGAPSCGAHIVSGMIGESMMIGDFNYHAIATARDWSENSNSVDGFTAQDTTVGFDDVPYAGLGHWLVRASSTAVPEPSIIALFALGFVGIGFARRRQS